ncbi:hypothetical protein PSPO01_10500 [Paraphaeosphaeria sporulosa]
MGTCIPPHAPHEPSGDGSTRPRFACERLRCCMCAARPLRRACAGPMSAPARGVKAVSKTSDEPIKEFGLDYLHQASGRHFHAARHWAGAVGTNAAPALPQHHGIDVGRRRQPACVAHQTCVCQAYLLPARASRCNPSLSKRPPSHALAKEITPPC